MDEVYVGIISVLVLVMFFTIDRTIKYYKQRKLFELVSWSAIGDYDPVLSRYSYINDLIFSIRRAQSSDSISAQYKVVEDEDFKLVREIVEEYQDHITKLYFRDKLSLFKSARVGIFNMDDPYSRRARADFGGISRGIGIIYDAEYKAKLKNSAL